MERQSSATSLSEKKGDTTQTSSMDCCLSAWCSQERAEATDGRGKRSQDTSETKLSTAAIMQWLASALSILILMQSKDVSRDWMNRSAQNQLQNLKEKNDAIYMMATGRRKP